MIENTRKRLDRRQIEMRLAAIAATVARGDTVAEACRAHDVAVPSYYRWLAERRDGPEAEGEQARETVLRAAGTVFLRDGFGASIDMVATTAGVSRQTVYNLFGSKDRLFAEVVQSVYRRTVMPVLVLDRTDDLPAMLETCGRHMLALMLDPEAVGLLRITLGEYREHPELAAIAYAMRASPILPNVASVIARRLDDEVAAGTIAPIDTELAAETFVGSFTAHARHRALIGLEAPSASELERRLQMAIMLFVRGLGYGVSAPAVRR
jgi:TetR/AcrR family transcriptional regulator, mexJK operon transcriptional repressor